MHSTRSSQTDRVDPQKVDRRSARAAADALFDRPVASEPVRAAVTVFNSAKNYGFANLVDDDRRAHFRGDLLDHHGGPVSRGTVLTVRVEDRALGLVVVEILDVDRSAARPESPPLGEVVRKFGRLTAICRDGYCFGRCDDDGSDVYISLRVAERDGLHDCRIGSAVEMMVGTTARGLVATRVAIKPAGRLITPPG